MGSRPLRNRVNPYGELVADPARGGLYGNRGCLHDEEGRIRRFYAVERWIFCRLEFKGRRRQLLQPGKYTELFFLDEATAFAAGHRPCWECMRDRAREFRDAWTAANPGRVPAPGRATEIDRALHGERIDAGGRVTFEAPLDSLPDGTMVLATMARGSQSAPHLVRHGRLWRWSFDGYAEPRTDEGVVPVLTPKSVVRAFAGGFRAGAGPFPSS